MKKKSLSNEILAGLVILATFVSLGSSLAIYNSIQTNGWGLSYGKTDNSFSGFATGKTNVSVAQVVAISLPVALIEFNSLSNNETNDTTDDHPRPFIIQNDGSVLVDLTIGATDLFSGTGGANPSGHYQFQSDNYEASTTPNSSALVTSWTNIPTTGSPVTFATDMSYVTSKDSLEGEIKITVPGDEAPGDKSSTVTFTATQSS